MLAERRRQRTTDKGQRTTGRRRGVTLVEMLVTVAVLVILMTILVQIFQAATGAVSAAQAYQQLDDQLRRLDGIIRADLGGVTAHFTPPLDPALNLGYFEYGENEYADSQGEDGDDYIRFTAKAPPGRPFTGRFWPNYWVSQSTSQAFPAGLSSLPITITSDYAEIIYFLRNGNLYRRVFLVAPELQTSVLPTIASIGYPSSSNPPTASPFTPSVIGQQVSWLGVNDLSAHPAATGPNYNTATLATQAASTIVLNTLGNLTNRENRAFYPRFANDFYNADPSTSGGQTFSSSIPDGIPDDINQDNIPDLYTSLYPNVFNTGLIMSYPNSNMTGYSTIASATSLLAFPYVFPGAYSKAQALSSDAYGWIHAPAPYSTDSAGNPYQFDQSPASYLQYLNHNPLDLGDNLPTPPTQVAVGKQNIAEAQTWWGFPTWRETLSPNWTDPTVQVNVGPKPIASGGPNGPSTSPGQPAGLTYASLNIAKGVLANPSNDQNLLPPMTAPSSFSGNFSIYRPTQQLYCDAAGGSSGFMSSTLWPLTWEDDLIMTNVRSFDVKAYDNALAGYGDLGWGDDVRMYQLYQNLTGYTVPATLPFLAGMTSPFFWPPLNTPTTQAYAPLQTMAHEGRVPPLVEDGIYDAQFGMATNYLPTTSPYLTANGGTYNNGNIGDDSTGVVRLRRVWDTWSTDYYRAPGTAVGAASNNGFPIGPPFSPPAYPSYPAPYPAALRGIQIQIRVADPSNQRVKQLTIRQDFTDRQ